MNSLIKIGVAGALALGGSVAAHASIVVPTSSGSTGDLVLFADVFNGTTLVTSYVGDTNISVDSVGSGTNPGTFTDSNLNTLLASATAGTTVQWALEGGFAHSGPQPYMVSSGTATALGKQSGQVLTEMAGGLVSEISNVNGYISGSSGLFTSDGNSALGGSGFNPGATAQDVTNWYGYTGNVATTGLGTESGLYLMSAASTAGGALNLATVSDLFNVALTSSGLVFSSLSSGGSPVPIPAAVWLLGSGLLGLAGVARRKAGTV